MFTLVLAHINNIQDICCRKQAGFFSFDDKNLQTRLKLVGEHPGVNMSFPIPNSFYTDQVQCLSHSRDPKFVTSLVQQWTLSFENRTHWLLFLTFIIINQFCLFIHLHLYTYIYIFDKIYTTEREECHIELWTENWDCRIEQWTRFENRTHWLIELLWNDRHFITAFKNSFISFCLYHSQCYTQ